MAWPLAVIPLVCGCLELGLWPSGRLNTLVAGPLAVLGEKWLWLQTRCTTRMIAICYAFRRLSGSMQTIDIAAVLDRKDVHEERRKITTRKTQERYFQKSLGHPSLPTALFVLADSRSYLTMLRICRFKKIALSYKWCCSTRDRRRRPQNMNKMKKKRRRSRRRRRRNK